MDPEKKEADVYSEVEHEDVTPAEPIAPETPPEPVIPEVKEEEKEPEKAEDDDDKSEPKPEPVAPVARKRSIYQDYKDKKNEAKTERELREAAERERDEALAKLNGDKATDSDEIEAFAKEINADPEALRRMKAVFLKDAPKGELSPELQAQLKEFQEFQAQNRDAIDKVQFDNEFSQAVPAIKNLVGEASPEETIAIKNALSQLAHSDQYHDKELDYIAFKNQDALKALISPKKRGLEPKRKLDSNDAPTSDFRPDADLSNLSEKDSLEWEKAYTEASKSDGLAVDSQGRKIFI